MRIQAGHVFADRGRGVGWTDLVAEVVDAADVVAVPVGEETLRDAAVFGLEDGGDGGGPGGLALSGVEEDA